MYLNNILKKFFISLKSFFPYCPPWTRVSRHTPVSPTPYFIKRTSSLKRCTLIGPIGHKIDFQTWQRRMSNCSITPPFSHFQAHFRESLNAALFIFWQIVSWNSAVHYPTIAFHKNIIHVWSGSVEHSLDSTT
jgi:hypothetical protein